MLLFTLCFAAGRPLGLDRPGAVAAQRFTVAQPAIDHPAPDFSLTTWMAINLR
ncbi:MAG: hypothetical protein R2867_33900 [Caldilineaceae bacterium]